MIEYKVDIRNIFNGDRRTINLGLTKTEAKETLKTVKKTWKFWWLKSIIYC